MGIEDGDPPTARIDDANPPTEPIDVADANPATEPRTELPRTRAVAGSIAAEDATGVAGPYALGEVIGRGGMGEVLLAHDRRIGRDVALKRLQTTSPAEDEMTRFMREARIQARLEHPAIVPVYEMGRDAVGRPFFTMKRVAGQTLAEMFASKYQHRPRMLRAFAEVCRTIDYAHSRGVVHRDLKPANIVLGDFGEVYVLDWGIARVVGDADKRIDMADIDTIEGIEKESAQIIGTLGYSSPEQLHAPNVDRPSDVYSLGAILFEILAGEPLHQRGKGAKHSTMGGETIASPALRRPDRNVPPELDTLCLAMLSSKPAARPTARRAAEQIEEFLDGDRDMARRRVMAHDLVSLAKDAIKEGRSSDGMRAASRALALDPEARDAAELVMHVMLQPPPTEQDVPPEVREELQRSDDEAVSQHARAATPGYIIIASFLPVIAWNGVRSWPVVLAMFGAAVLMTIGAWDLTRRPRKSLAHMVAYAICNSLLLAIMGRLASPWLVVPAVVAFTTGSVVTYPTFLVRKWLLIGIMLAGFLLPLGLEAIGVLPPTWRMDESGFVAFGDAMHVHGTPTIVTMLGGALAIMLMAGLQSSRVGNASRAAHHRLVLQAHQLRQLLPSR
ncbi:MAG TPA: serine/threonine-protein kinase [Kofleriaceae bacterium]|nr:serine/threonine-protein kinase [Kofleriaceae bacterium]